MISRLEEARLLRHPWNRPLVRTTWPVDIITRYSALVFYQQFCVTASSRLVITRTNFFYPGYYRGLSLFDDMHQPNRLRKSKQLRSRLGHNLTCLCHREERAQGPKSQGWDNKDWMVLFRCIMAVYVKNRGNIYLHCVDKMQDTLNLKEIYTILFLKKCLYFLPL
jgi:hypothetical protein